jgi:hypothetical protein
MGGGSEMFAVFEVPEDQAEYLFHLDGDDCRSIFYGTTERTLVSPRGTLRGMTEYEDCPSCAAYLLVGAESLV